MPTRKPRRAAAFIEDLGLWALAHRRMKTRSGRWLSQREAARSWTKPVTGGAGS